MSYSRRAIACWAALGVAFAAAGAPAALASSGGDSQYTDPLTGHQGGTGGTDRLGTAHHSTGTSTGTSNTSPGTSTTSTTAAPVAKPPSPPPPPTVFPVKVRHKHSWMRWRLPAYAGTGSTTSFNAAVGSQSLRGISSGSGGVVAAIVAAGLIAVLVALFLLRRLAQRRGERRRSARAGGLEAPA